MRVRIRSRRAATRPSMTTAMHHPLLEHHSAIGPGVHVPRIGTPVCHLAPLHRLPQVGRSARLRNNVVGVARMHDTDREAFVAASAILKPLGVPLLDAVKGYAAATQALRGNGSLLDAAKEYAKRHPTAVKSKPLPDVADEFCGTKSRTAHRRFISARSATI